jgi:hypothetical protein
MGSEVRRQYYPNVHLILFTLIYLLALEPTISFHNILALLDKALTGQGKEVPCYSYCCTRVSRGILYDSEATFASASLFDVSLFVSWHSV